MQIVKNIKRPQGISPSLPSGMDKILKEHFDRFMSQGKLPPELKEIKDCKLFDDASLLEIWRNNKKGLEFLDKKSDVLLHGAIDNLLVNKDKLIVLDYKTRGFPLKADTHSYYQVQMDLYNFLLRKNNYITEDYAYLLFYYPKEVLSSGEVVFNSELVKLKISVKNGEKVFNDAVECVLGKIPE
ncbi:PD-(D/E)XK nuclease family protein, partial [Candidatus Woesearchaeota archaeon]|nr:PD-(D/E)XK nuclease family protein [Candidatus Woesearchaeota archaeon]